MLVEVLLELLIGIVNVELLKTIHLCMSKEKQTLIIAWLGKLSFLQGLSCMQEPWNRQMEFSGSDSSLSFHESLLTDQCTEHSLQSKRQGAASTNTPN